jgi:hypothetical protein
MSGMSFEGSIAFLVMFPLALYAMAYAYCEWKQPKYQDAIEDVVFIIGWILAVAIVWNY